MEAQKSVRKELMANNRDQPHYNTLSTIGNLEERKKDT
jgi:hypothetical protein